MWGVVDIVLALDLLRKSKWSKSLDLRKVEKFFQEEQPKFKRVVWQRVSDGINK